MEQRGLTRREMLERGIAVVGAGGLALAGFTGSAWPGDKAAAATLPASPAAPQAARGVRHFVSRPDLTPPDVTITRHGPAGTSTAGDPPYFLLTPSAGRGTPGLMMLDRAGGLVWFSPSRSQGTERLDLKVQSYQGKPVLTWWEGQVLAGYGKGHVVIADSSYRPIATVNAGHGLAADLHEIVITPQDTALITIYKPVTANLSRVGGPAKGVVLAGVVQEIDIASGRVLFEWSSIDHVPVTDTVASFTGGTAKVPFDYFHINSISIAPDGTLLVSARNTSTVYKIARPSGKVIWRLGGRRSSFRMGPGTTFWFQHQALPQGANTVSLFDDGGAPPKEPQSRGLLINLDTRTMRATLRRSYIHPTPRLLAGFEGSMQVLAGGRVLVGWGNTPYFSEFTANGTLILDGHYPGGDQTYRVLSAAWTGEPTDQPAVAVRAGSAGSSVVYASWNGATRVASWTVLAGNSPNRLARAGSKGPHGFETAITVNNRGPYFAVTANDASGQPLGQSPTILAPN
jgi:arylsulfotransferase ASST